VRAGKEGKIHIAEGWATAALYEQLSQQYSFTSIQQERVRVAVHAFAG